MKTRALFVPLIVAYILLLSIAAHAQEPDVPSKVEVGVQFSSLTYSGPPVFGAQGLSPGYGSSEAGFGGRFTFNFNQHVALEAEGNFFPHPNSQDQRRNGRLLQGQFGIKAGKRFGKFGVFGKARPGFASFSRVLTVIGTQTFDFGGVPVTYPVFAERRKTYFSMDVGGALEFYPSRRVLTRIDVGDTMIRYNNENIPFGVLPAITTTTTSRTTSHNLQISAGVGFRLGSVQTQPTTDPAHKDKQDRFEVGLQFSSLSLQEIERCIFCLTVPYRDVLTQPGFGGRLTYNLTPGIALELQSDFYPRKNQLFINNGRAGGRVLQAQSGVKAGKRFEKFGFFGKARPGVISFSDGLTFKGIDPTFGFPIYGRERKTYFSMDLGGVLEFYPSARIVTRFDAGDTIIRYRTFALPGPFLLGGPGFQVPAETTHNFQFSAGVGFRF